MSNNPQTDDPIGDTTPESARALLYRHGLPEDVIDGALCLHAQELAAVQRREADDLHQTEPGVVKGLRIGADLIDPTRADDPAASPAVPVPPTTHAEAAGEEQTDRLAQWLWDNCAEDERTGLLADDPRRIATVALHWPALRRLADEAQQQPEAETPASAEPLASGLPLVKGNCPACRRASLFLGTGGYPTCSNADCTEPDAATTVLEQYANEAHDPEHTWAAELHDPLADEWVPGTRYLARDRAVKALAHAQRIGPTWKDGTPTQRRLVRATTTYTVEQPAGGPGRVADEEPAETGTETADEAEA